MWQGKLKEILNEAKSHPQELVDAAHRHYQGIAPDLLQAVPEGHGHTDAAIGHIADHLYDNYNKSHPKANFRAIAKKVALEYGNDRKETRANEKKQERKWAAKNKPPKVVKSKVPEPWWKKAGYTTPMTKPRKGIGSYGKAHGIKEGVENIDSINVNVPLFIRLLEFAREDAKGDMVLHEVAENILSIHKSGVKILSMDNYEDIVKTKSK